MKGRWYRYAVVLLLAMLLSFGGGVCRVSAEDQPTDSFTHWELSQPNEKKAVSMADVYQAVSTVTPRTLGFEEWPGTLRHMATDESGEVWLLFEEGSLYRLNAQLTRAQEVCITSSDGTPVDFTGARGLSLRDGKLFLSDTEHARVLCCTEDGKVLEEYLLPSSELIPSDFSFRPIRSALDSKGYLYVVSEGSYYGAVLYDPERNFMGFYGANTVKASPLDALKYVWDLLTGTNEKHAKSERKLPYQFVDLCIDKKDFVFTCTGATGVDTNMGQAARLSPGGTNTLFRRYWDGSVDSAANYTFGESEVVRRLGLWRMQNFVSIQVDEAGFIYLLDNTYGLVYIYDTDCNLLTAFGGGSKIGERQGLFKEAAALAIKGETLLVADAYKSSITVFERTDYGRTLMQAQRLTLSADYTEAEPYWERVLSEDSSSRLALRGLGKAAYAKEEYNAALKYAEAGYDGVTYSQALAKVESAFIERHFVWLFPSALLLIGGLAAFAVLTIRRRVRIVANDRLRTVSRMMFHPFESFQDIKYKNQGSLLMAIGLGVLFYMSSVLATLYSNFRFTDFDATTYNALFEGVRTLGLVILWSLVNWGVCVLFGGKGRLREIFIVTAYSTLPLVMYNFISWPMSYLLTQPDSALLSGLHIVALIVTGLLLCIGTMTIHEISFPRFVLTSAAVVLGMLLVIFICFMLGILLNEFGNFLISIFMEVVYR